MKEIGESCRILYGLPGHFSVEHRFKRKWGCSLEDVQAEVIKAGERRGGEGEILEAYALATDAAVYTSGGQGGVGHGGRWSS